MTGSHKTASTSTEVEVFSRRQHRTIKALLTRVARKLTFTFQGVRSILDALFVRSNVKDFPTAEPRHRCTIKCTLIERLRIYSNIGVLYSVRIHTNTFFNSSSNLPSMEVELGFNLPVNY